jgi:hypothetical protein
MTKRNETKAEYRVYEANGTRCIRKFESLDDAKAWAWTVATGKSYRIEWAEEDGRANRVFA